MTKTRRAALKAWDTRRKNELAAKRSQAAQKAWATRRANGEGFDIGDSCFNSIAACDVIQALVDGKRGGNKLFDRYVDQQVELGYEETRVRAAIKAHVTRRVA